MTTSGPTKGHLPYKTLEKPPPPPIITVLAIALFPFVTMFINGQSLIRMPSDQTTSWVVKHSFSAPLMLEHLTKGDYPGLFQLWFGTCFSELSPLMWAINAFFLWCFGHVVEKKLKTLRYG